MKSPRTIFITGASSGLGRALALAYAENNTSLFLTGRDEKRLKQTVELCEEKGATITYHAMDICDAERVAAWINDIAEHSSIDLVIANAGISGGTGGQGVNSGETDTQTKKIFDTNVTGVLNTLLPLIPHMKRRSAGQIALISSLASFRGLPSAPAYSASKAAVRFYGEALRGELADAGIKVTVVCPGYIRTPMTDVNNFPMPMLMDADKAAEIIKRRLKKAPARIAFPFPVYFVIWLLGCLPPCMTDWIFARLPKKS